MMRLNGEQRAARKVKDSEAVREAYRARAGARAMSVYKQKKAEEQRLKKARKNVTSAMTQKMAGTSAPADNSSRLAKRTKGVRFK